jgi:hypothetical protein
MDRGIVPEEALPGDCRLMSVTEQLRDRKERLKRELLEIEKVLEALTKNPETQAIIDSLYRLGYQ